MESCPPAERRILVVVPALNEAASVASTIERLRAVVPDYDVLVVDDGSTDGTADKAFEAGALVCRLPFNLGVGGAMRAGYRYALRHDYDIAIQVDADGQHDPSFLPRMVARLEEADIVVGARFAGIGEYPVGTARKLAMRGLAGAISRISETQLTDVTSGFRVVNRKALEVFAKHYPAEYLGDTVESLVIALRMGCRVQQEPVEMSPRVMGNASQSPISASLYLMRAVVALGLALVRRWPSEEVMRGHA